MEEQWKIDYNNLLLKTTGYSGNKKPGKKTISCSSLTNNMLELYLDYKHGKQEDTKFEASNVGSMYQLGVDKACENLEFKGQYISAERYEYELENGWKLTGETDQRDTINKFIIDNKVSTATALKKVQKEGLGHNYAVQQGGYKFLVKKETGEDYKAALAFVDKSASYFKPTSGPTLNLFEIETYDYETIEAMALEKTNELQYYIDNDEEPPICEDRFPYKFKGKTIPMKCKHYCNYSKFCKHYSEYQDERSTVAMLEVDTRKSVTDEDTIASKLVF